MISLEETLDVDEHTAAPAESGANATDPEGASMREQLRTLLERSIDGLPAAFRAH